MKSIRLNHRCRKADGFTLIELLVVVGIITILLSMLLPALVRAKDAARKAECMSNLRQLAIVYHLYSEDFGNKLPSVDMLGNSSYRLAADPLGLPACFSAYVPATSKVWLCPAGRRLLEINGVNYAWSRAQNLVGDGGDDAAFDNMSATVSVWDNFTYILPSVYNVSEGTSGGPPAVTTATLRYYPHHNHTQADYLYLDGHVEMK